MAFSAFTIETILPCCNIFDTREQILPAMQFAASMVTKWPLSVSSTCLSANYSDPLAFRIGLGKICDSYDLSPTIIQFFSSF